MKIVPVFADRIGSLEDATAIEITPTLKARKPLKPERIKAVRNGSIVKVDVFPITKVYLTGAGKMSADSYTDTYPFEYEGQIVVSIDGGDETLYNTCHFTVDNPNSFTLSVRAKWNGYYSDSLSLTVGTTDGEYVAN